jgi:hypothetical protein
MMFVVYAAVLVLMQMDVVARSHKTVIVYAVEPL